MTRREWLAASAGGALAACSDGAETGVDALIYGGTSGGVAAAVQAARMGKSVVLIEPGRHLGGMTSGGLSAVDIGNPRTVGGVAREYFTRLSRQYGRTLAWDRELEGVPTGGAFAVEPHSAEQLFRDLIDEHAVPVVYGRPLREVRKQGPRITGVVLADGSLHRARMFIDCTYEGDLMAAAGVDYTMTREANSQYGETRNGIWYNPRYEPKVEWGVAGPNGRRADGKGLWDRDIPIDPYRRAGDPSSGLLPLVEPEPDGRPGDAAPGVQAYCFRLCLTRNPSNRIPLEKPSDYDPARYELVARFIAACVAAGDDMDLRWFSKHDPIPSDKYDFNTATFGANLPGASWAWPEADWDRRRGILREHESYHRGLLHFLATDPRVPEKVRTEMGEFGLCRDEFPETDGWPHQIYVREARRMVGELVMTERHSMSEEVAPKSVGLGSYGVDLHEIRRVVHDGIVWREGKGGGRVPQPYPIGYHAVTPKRSQAENLLVTFALSASHVAFGSTRMEPPLMILSQSAATAAALAIDTGVAVQDVDYRALAERLRADGQVLTWPNATSG